MPLDAGDDRQRAEPEPDVPKPSWNRPRIERQRQRPWPPPPPPPPPDPRIFWLVEPLPPSFMWLIAENTWVSQGDIKAFWLAREKRTTGNFWPGWRWGNPHQLKENP